MVQIEHVRQFAHVDIRHLVLISAVFIKGAFVCLMILSLQTHTVEVKHVQEKRNESMCLHENEEGLTDFWIECLRH
jgi:hypothetical protein